MNRCGCGDEAAALERLTLWMVLLINATMFAAEAVAGWLAESTSLLADSLDMGADAAVYATALCAVGRSQLMKVRTAKVSGCLQIALGLGVLVEASRRTIVGSDPIGLMMIAVGSAALVANIGCLVLLAKHRDGGVHMRASWIFSTNDVIANIGVVLAGVMVMLLGSRLPDLLIGGLVAIIVCKGGVTIIQDAAAVGPQSASLPPRSGPAE